MSTVKISELPELSGGLNANTSNSLFLGVDIPTGVTGKFTATQLAERLYANNVLVVGENPVTFPNVTAQFSGGSDNYVQTNHQNLHANGSGDVVVTADVGTDVTHYIDLGIAGSNYNYPGYTVYNKRDGYLLVQGGETSATPGGNLAIGTVTQNRDIIFFQGGGESANAVASFVYGSGLKLLQKPLTFADGTTQNTAGRGAGFSQAAFDAANTAASNTRYTQGVDTTQNTNIASVNTYSYSAYAQANASNTLAIGAFAKANAALANATGTFSGDLTITGNTFAQSVNTANLQVVGTTNVSGTLNVVGNVTLVANTYMTGGVTVNSTMVLANSNFSATEAALTITASGTTATPSNDGYMLHISGKNGVPSRVIADSYGTNSYVVYAGRAARGTVTSPTALQANDVIARISSNGYGTTKYQTLGVGRIDFIAAENFTDANTGSQIKFYNCPIGSNTLTNILSLNGDSAVFTGVVEPMKGFIYVPTVLQGAQTAFTIDFSTTALIRATLAADLTITLSNYVYGKVVEVWLTNTGGLSRTVTHGCTATNSSENSTTFTIPGTSSAYLRYFSIDGDNANTFVAIQHG